jgi:flagellar protein FliL
VTSLVIMSLSLEVTIGTSESIYAREPKLRDAMLQVMFDHANAGGFNGMFTDGANLVFLRKAFLEVSQKIIGDEVKDVLISDISRQDS